MTPDFEAWYTDECAIDAAELVGPNSLEYESVRERFEDDNARREAAWGRYWQIRAREVK